MLLFIAGHSMETVEQLSLSLWQSNSTLNFVKPCGFDIEQVREQMQFECITFREKQRRTGHES
jgi:hypothetical protein